MPTEAQTTPRGGIVPVIDIHRRLRIARDIYNARMNQDDFGALVGMSGNTVGNYETGAVTRLKDIYIQKWADVTGVSYWWLKTGLDDEKGPVSEETGPECTPTDSNREPTDLRPANVTFVTFGAHPSDTAFVADTESDGTAAYWQENPMGARRQVRPIVKLHAAQGEVA